MIIELFNKEIYDLRIEDLVNYFKSPREESDVIEYKSYEIKRQNNHKEKEKIILKTICAFLNSNGGILIWGAPVEKTNSEGEKYYEGELSLIDRQIRKDDFVAKILNRIVPVADNIKFHPITNDNKNYAIIFEVGESAYKPHQADSKYWMRADGQTITAPHHFIEALFKQVKYPNLEGYIKVNLISSTTIDRPIGFKLNHTYYKIELEYFVFNFSGFINEENLSVSLMCINGKFGNYQIDGFRHRHHTNGHVYYNDNIKETLYYGAPFSEKHIIFVDPEDIKACDDEVEIWILFGGKKSPQKRSIYKYDLHIRKERIVNPQPIVIIENKLAIDAAIEIGKTKEELIKDLLNRE